MRVLNYHLTTVTDSTQINNSTSGHLQLFYSYGESKSNLKQAKLFLEIHEEIQKMLLRK